MCESTNFTDGSDGLHVDPAAKLYDEARTLMDSGLYFDAIQRFEQSAALHVHYKTLQLLGDCLLRVGEVQRAVVPLAAATWLTRQATAPTLLAEALLKLGRRADAERAAQYAVDIMPHFKKAQSLLEEIRGTSQRPQLDH